MLNSNAEARSAAEETRWDNDISMNSMKRERHRSFLGHNHTNAPDSANGIAPPTQHLSPPKITKEPANAKPH